MSDTNSLILSHHFNYSFFSDITIIGDSIGDNGLAIGDIIGDIIGVIGATSCDIYYDIRRLFYDIGAIFYDICVLNNNFECSIPRRNSAGLLLFSSRSVDTVFTPLPKRLT